MPKLLRDSVNNLAAFVSPNPQTGGRRLNKICGVGELSDRVVILCVEPNESNAVSQQKFSQVIKILRMT